MYGEEEEEEEKEEGGRGGEEEDEDEEEEQDKEEEKWGGEGGEGGACAICHMPTHALIEYLQHLRTRCPLSYHAPKAGRIHIFVLLTLALSPKVCTDRYPLIMRP